MSQTASVNCNLQFLEAGEWILSGLEQNQAKNFFQKNDQSSIISEIKDDESKYYH